MRDVKCGPNVAGKEKKMRIGIDISTLCNKWDGIGSYLLNELEYMNSLADNNVFFLYADRPLERKLEFNERFHFVIDDGKNHLLWLLTKLPQHIVKDRIDVFWQPNFIFPRKVKGTHLVVTVHDMSAYSYSEYASTKTNITHKLFLKRTCQIADRVLAISKNCADEIVTELGVSAEKISMIYIAKSMFENGLDATEKQIDECLNRYGISKEEYILFVGTLSPRKNDMVMIKSYIEYRKRGGTKKLILAGNIAAKSERAKELIQTCEYRDDIVLTGYISELEKRIFYYYAAMLLFPSRLEGFGFPLLEAMQAEIPVITSNVSCMPEIAEDAALYLNDIDNENELCQCIFKVENLTKAEKEAVIQRGKKRVEFFEKQEFQKQTYAAISNV